VTWADSGPEQTHTILCEGELSSKNSVNTAMDGTFLALRADSVRERFSSGRQRLGHISKQGWPLLRWLLVEAAQSAVRHEPEMQRHYRRMAVRKHRALAKVAVARKLAVRLYWMLSHSVVAGQKPSTGVGSLPPRPAGRSNELIMVAGSDRRDGWRDPASPARLENGPWSTSKTFSG
jgi:transposase IS116/IS110/IS902 family protein